MSSFGPHMKARRMELGLSLRDVETICDGGLSNAYLSQLENGKIKNPSAHVVLMLCAAYLVSHEEALGWLQHPMRITPPKMCSECGRVLPIERETSFLIDEVQP